jgi:hypothetical protein
VTARTLDWLFPLLGYTLAALGAALLLWSLFRDRARGRRRCPKCWYDMAGIAALRCPECGHEARSEKRLARTRRKWRLALLAALIGAAGLLTARAPDYRRGGWVGALPTWALAIWAPAKVPLAPGSAPFSGAAIVTPGPVVPIQTRASTGSSRAGSITIQPGASFSLSGGSAIQTNPGAGGFLVLPGGSYTIGAAPTVTVPAGQAAAISYAGAVTLGPWPPPEAAGVRLHREVWARLAQGRFWAWEGRLYMTRVLGANPSVRPGDALTFPHRWPRTVPVPFRGGSPPPLCTMEVRAQGADWVSGRADGSFSLDGGASGKAVAPLELRLRIAGKIVHTEVFTAHIALSEGYADLLDRLDSPQINRQVLAALRPRLQRDGGAPVLAFNDREAADPWTDLDYGVFFRAAVRGASGALATGAGAADWLRPVWKTEELVRLTPTGPIPDGPLELVLTGDPAAAGEYYCTRPFSGLRPACWAGELIIPIARIEDKEKPPPPGGGP